MPPFVVVISLVLVYYSLWRIWADAIQQGLDAFKIFMKRSIR